MFCVFMFVLLNADACIALYFILSSILERPQSIDCHFDKRSMEFSSSLDSGSEPKDDNAKEGSLTNWQVR